MDISGTASGNDALFYGSSRGSQGVFHTELSFLHLCLSGSADTDHRYAACQLGKSLLQLFPVKIRCRLVNLCLDLCDTALNFIFSAFSVHDNSIFFLNLNGFCTAKLIQGGLLQIESQLLADHLAACQDSDILKHFLSSVTVTRRLYRYYVKGSAKLVDHQSAKSLALNILGNDQQSGTCLNHLLKKGKDLLNIRNLLICDQDVWVV